MYEDVTIDPLVIFCTIIFFHIIANSMFPNKLMILKEIQVHGIGNRSRLFLPIHVFKKFEDNVGRVCVCVKLSSKDLICKLFYGVLEGLDFDLGLQRWTCQEELMKHLVIQGRKMLKSKIKFIALFLKCEFTISHQTSN